MPGNGSISVARRALISHEREQLVGGGLGELGGVEVVVEFDQLGRSARRADAIERSLLRGGVIERLAGLVDGRDAAQRDQNRSRPGRGGGFAPDLFASRAVRERSWQWLSSEIGSRWSWSIRRRTLREPVATGLGERQEIVSPPLACPDGSTVFALLVLKHASSAKAVEPPR